MNTKQVNNSVQPEPASVDTLQAANARFAIAVKAQLEIDPQKWGGTESEAVLRQLLVQDDGTPLPLSPEEDEIIRLAVNPSVDRQYEIVARIAAKHGRQLNQADRVNVRRLLSPAAFRQELVKAGAIKAVPRSATPSLAELLKE